jgi:hypothetical protein
MRMTSYFALATYVAAAVRRHPTVWSVAAWTDEAKIHLAIFMIFVGSESQADHESIGIGDQLLHLFGADVKVIEGYVSSSMPGTPGPASLVTCMCDVPLPEPVIVNLLGDRQTAN